MKKIVLLFSLFLLFYNAEAQKWTSEYTMGYNWLNPMGDLREKVERADGFNMEFFMNTPDKHFGLGLEMSFGNYGAVEFPVNFNNSEVITQKNVRVFSQIFNTFLTGRCYLKTEGPFIPYVNLKAGISAFATSLRIEKDEGSHHCMDDADIEDLHCSGTFAMSVGGGFKADMSYVFKKVPSQSFFLDFSCSYIGGGTVSYLSPNARLNAGDTNNGTPYDEFVKTDQGVVHVDNVGNVYNSMASMLDFRIGISVRPSGWRHK